MPEAEPALRGRWGAGSGARAGDLYRRLLALIFLIAWISLGRQVRLLIGARGLMPIGDFIDALRARGGVSFIDFPTVFWWFHGDAALVAGTVVGAALAIAALAGVRPRLCFALSTVLYLSYATACRTFLSFQWDNLLLECGLLASFLPPGRASPLRHFLFRCVLFKLYFESGVAKWQSPIHDWQDGSAMTFYYETAPLPTWLGWWAHNLPAAWHHFESRAVLVLELVVPFAIFGTRRLRLAAAALFTGFQILNIATANYGFFCYLALALHVFLLDDGDIERAAHALARLARFLPAPLRQALERRLATPGAPDAGPAVDQGRARRRGGVHRRVAPAGAVRAHRGERQPVGVREGARSSTSRCASSTPITCSRRSRANASSPNSRPAPTAADAVWTAHDLRHKPGDPARAPDFVAPHQPRVDFQLWFYGLAFERREPSYVAHAGRTDVQRPGGRRLAVPRAPLPEHPDAVRIVYWRYHFTTRAERRATGAWWRRESIGATRAVPCDR